MSTKAAYRRDQQRKIYRATNPDYTWAVPASKVRELIEIQAKRYQLGYKALALAAGIGISQMWRIRTGKTVTAYPSTMKKLNELPYLVVMTLI
jgi:hypothetical protein